MLFSINCHAERLPLWELGIAAGVAQIPYYRGSSQVRNIVLPLPLAQYRGEKYGVDDEGAHRWLWITDWMKVDFSVAGGLPVPNGGRVKLRQGMSELDAMLEVGPSLDISLWHYQRHNLSVHFPLRLAASIDWLEVNSRGMLFTPYFNYSYQSFSPNYWQINLAAGPQYASESYHDYYYEVTTAQANQDRPFFDAKSGYSGARITAYANKRMGRLWLSAFARCDFLQEAVFENSPLVEEKETLVAGVVIGWVLIESPRQVIVRQGRSF